MAVIVTFGEIMMRLQPPHYQRLTQAQTFEIVYGGGEANVAVALQQLGAQARYVTALPDHAVGEACMRRLRAYGVDTSCIYRAPGRLGIYFCEKGCSVRPSVVLYDRKDSLFACSGKEHYDWDAILDGADWLHVTGITPALSESVREAMMQGLRAAKEKGVMVSCDLNYRGKLWSRERACEVMSEVMRYVDVLIANEEDCKDVFGIVAPHTDIEEGVLNVQGYEQVCRQVEDRFGIHRIAITMRESYNASENGWSAMFYDHGTCYVSRKYRLQIVDRVGGGDSFAAGLIYALQKGYGPQQTVEFAVAASAWKHTVEGDCNELSLAEITRLAAGGASGRVQR